MKTNHTITDVEFNGTPSCGVLFYVADGEEVEVQGEFYMDENGVIHHEHWFDEEGEDVVNVCIDIRTYDVYFDSDESSNNKGFSGSCATLEYCRGYIESFNGTNESYFEDYKGGIVRIVCNETGETVYEEEVR